MIESRILIVQKRNAEAPCPRRNERLRGQAACARQLSSFFLKKRTPANAVVPAFS